MSNPETANTTEKRYTEDEAARLLGFKARLTLWRWRRRGMIGYYRIGSRIYYGEHHLREFLLNCERGPRSRFATRGGAL